MRKCLEVCKANGQGSACAAMVLLGMAEFGMDYRAALEECAAYKDCAPERLHAELCYDILAADRELLRVEQLFENMKVEVLASEDGVHAAKGG